MTMTKVNWKEIITALAWVLLWTVIMVSGNIGLSKGE